MTEQITEIKTDLPANNQTIQFEGKKIDIPDLDAIVAPPVETPKEPPKVAIPDSLERRKLMHRLNIQKENFPDAYRAIMDNYGDVKFVPTERLGEVANEVQSKISSQNAPNVVKGVVFAGCSILEQSAPYIGMDLEGLSKVVSNPANKEFDTILRELQCKYPYGMEGMSPEVKLLFQLGLTCYTLDSHNKQKKKAELMKPIDQNDKKKFDNL